MVRSKSGKHQIGSDSTHGTTNNAGDCSHFRPNDKSPENYIHFIGSLAQIKISQNWLTRSWMLLQQPFSKGKTYCTTQSSRD